MRVSPARIPGVLVGLGITIYSVIHCLLRMTLDLSDPSLVQGLAVSALQADAADLRAPPIALSIQAMINCGKDVAGSCAAGGSASTLTTSQTGACPRCARTTGTGRGSTSASATRPGGTVAPNGY